MFAAKENIVPHFKTICSIDQGSDVNPCIWAIKSIVEKLMSDEAGRGTFYYIDVDPGMEASMLRGADINLGLPTEDFYLAVCLDIHGLTLSSEGRTELIDYFADLTKEYFWYAQSQLQAQKSKKRTRKSRKTA